MKAILVSLFFLAFLASCDVFIMPCSFEFTKEYNDLRREINNFAIYNQAEKLGQLKEKCENAFQKYGLNQRCVAKLNGEGQKSEEIEVSMADFRPSCDALP